MRTRHVTMRFAELRGVGEPALDVLRADMAFCHPAIVQLASVDAASGAVDLEVRADTDEADLAAQVTAVVSSSLRAGRLIEPAPPLWRRDAPAGAGCAALDEFRARHVTELGPGQYALHGPAAGLHAFFEREIAVVAADLGAEPWTLPGIEATHDLLRRTGYFSSHPQHVTFGYRLATHHAGLRRFADDARGRGLAALEEVHDVEPTGFILGPVVCHNVFRALRGVSQRDTRAITAASRCYRYEGFRFAPLVRQWEFTMREVVLLGPAAFVEDARGRALARTQALCEELDLGGTVEVASDPFFADDGAAAGRAFQLMERSKLELRLALGGGEATAAASFNRHGTRFSSAMRIVDEGGDPVATACVGWGIERWMAAFVARWGAEPEGWPIAA